MLLLTLTGILLMAEMQASAMTPTHDELAMITPAPVVRELEKRRGGRGGGGGGGYGGVVADFKYDTTCGLIPHSLALQNGLYGSDTSSAAKNTPYPIVCYGLCAKMGNYLGCIQYKTASVPSACHDYSATKTGTARCTSGDPCYWDKTCPYGSPYCNQNIYQASITQFTCGTKKNAPVTMQTPITLVPYIPVLANQTSASTSTPEPVTFKRTLSNFGLSIAGFVGICIAVGFVLVGGIAFWCRRRRRGRKVKVHKGEVQYAKVDVPYQYPQQQQQQQTPPGNGFGYVVYQQQQQSPPSHQQQQQPLMGGHGQQQGYYQGYHNQYHH